MSDTGCPVKDAVSCLRLRLSAAQMAHTATPTTAAVPPACRRAAPQLSERIRDPPGVRANSAAGLPTIIAPFRFLAGGVLTSATSPVSENPRGSGDV